MSVTTRATGSSSQPSMPHLPDKPAIRFPKKSWGAESDPPHMSTYNEASHCTHIRQAAFLVDGFAHRSLLAVARMMHDETEVFASSTISQRPVAVRQNHVRFDPVLHEMPMVRPNPDPMRVAWDGM